VNIFSRIWLEDTIVHLLNEHIWCICGSFLSLSVPPSSSLHLDKHSKPCRLSNTPSPSRQTLPTAGVVGISTHLQKARLLRLVGDVLARTRCGVAAAIAYRLSVFTFLLLHGDCSQLRHRLFAFAPPPGLQRLLQFSVNHTGRDQAVPAKAFKPARKTARLAIHACFILFLLPPGIRQRATPTAYY